MTTTPAGVNLPLLRHHQFLLRRLHSLTGLVFGGYLVIHLLVNATVAQGGNVYQLQVDKLESLPFLRAVEWITIYIPILFHTFYGVWIVLTGQPNAISYPYGKNWLYLLQRISAGVIVLFLIFHVLSLRFQLFGPSLAFNPQNATYTTWQHMNAYGFVKYFVYPVGIFASCYHLANGLWTAAITWGLTLSADAQRRFGWICLALFLLLLFLGLLAWAALLTMPRPVSLNV